MASDIRIALDAMGGDSGPSVVVPAAAIALVRRPDLEFLLYGDEKLVRADPRAHPSARQANRRSFIPTSRSR